METKELARAVILVAIAVALSPFFIPVGIAKCFPAQHMVNVLSAVMLGPAYAVAIATTAGIIRNILGLGTLLAFPGGMIGALLAGLAYRASKNIYVAGLGEVIERRLAYQATVEINARARSGITRNRNETRQTLKRQLNLLARAL